MPGPLEVQAMPEQEIIMLAHLLGDGSFVRNQPIRYASTDEANWPPWHRRGTALRR